MRVPVCVPDGGHDAPADEEKSMSLPGPAMQVAARGGSTRSTLTGRATGCRWRAPRARDLKSPPIITWVPTFRWNCSTWNIFWRFLAVSAGSLTGLQYIEMIVMFMPWTLSPMAAWSSPMAPVAGWKLWICKCLLQMTAHPPEVPPASVFEAGENSPFQPRSGRSSLTMSWSSFLQRTFR